MRFFDYDFNTGEIIEYTRNGECCHCGDCCTTRLKFSTIERKGIGLWACVREEGKPDFWQQVRLDGEIGGEVCQQYTGSGCMIYESRLRMCRTWPMSPAQLALCPRCSYSFVEISRVSMGS
jgi:hypothetical protein